MIDVHAHYQKQDGYLERMLEKSAGAGVRQIWLNGAGHRCGQHNSAEVLKACRKHPDRLVPFAFFFLGKNRPTDVKSFRNDGFRGLKIQFPLAPNDHPGYMNVYAQAEQLCMPILFHTGFSARFACDDRVYRSSSAFMRPVFLDTIARAFPNLKIIGAHLGWPWCWEASCAMLFNSNVYFDLSGIDRSGKLWPSLLNFRELLWKKSLWGQLVLGTEGGPANYALVVKEHRALFRKFHVGQDVVRKIFSGNALDMLGGKQ